MKQHTAKTPLVAVLVVAAVAAVGVTVFQVRRQAEAERLERAGQLLDEIQALKHPMRQASLEFTISLQASLEASDPSATERRESLEAAHQTLVRTVDAALRSTSRLDAGDDPDNEALIASERRYLQQMRQIFRTDFLQIIAVLHDDSQPVPERRRRAEEQLDQAVRDGRQHIEAADKFRREFVRQFGHRDPP